MFGKLLVLALSCGVCLPSAPASAQTGLSQNSGINSSDTWVVFDLTINDAATANFSQAIYNPSTQSYTTSLPISPAAQNYHVEAGYDPNGGLVVNLWPKGSVGSIYSTDTSNLGGIRFAGGQISVFDQNGNVIPNVMPDSRIPANAPLSVLGSNAGSSVIASLVVPNIQQYSSAMSASLSINAQSAVVQSNFTQGGNATWTYAQSGSNWIAQQAIVNVSTTQYSDSRTMQFSNVNWSDNTSNDAARAAAGSTIGTLPTAAPFPPTDNWTPPTSPALSQDSTTISPTDCNTHTYNPGGPQNIVFQHGLRSTSCAWIQMMNWLNKDYTFGNEIAPSLDNTAGIATQGQALIGQIQSVGGNSYILMGHSMGGLVSRYAAQYFQANNPAALSGVATVDTPNLGANSAVNLPVAAAGFLGFYAGKLWIDNDCTSQFDNWGCFLAVALAGGSGYVASYYANTPALQDLTPGSQALNSLNANHENFTRAAVVGYTPQRWLFARVAWNWYLGTVCPPTDGQCCLPDSWCGERAAADAAEVYHDELLATALVLFFEMETYCEYDQSGNCQVPAWMIDDFQQEVNRMIDMDVVDAVFDFLVALPGDGTSDGLVQGPSQLYPGSGAVQYPVSDADSHSGALKSSKDRHTLDALLATTFHMMPSASCSFSVPSSLSSPDTFSASGGSDSFNVSTSAGCAWSATAQEPWITITSGVNGMGGGTVSFTVAALNGSSPRTGSIQIGNGNGNATFYISQYGACSYTLSQAAIIAIPSSGASNTVQVSTQPTCTWAAASNAGWLTITNSNGTGSGSFTWTAAANTGNMGRTGMIDVANQTLTIVDGNPVGTPGTATVTITGSPQVYTFNPCAPYGNCYQAVPESGTVSVIVDGVTFTTGYGGGTTAYQIASNLAASMNYQYSPVTATANGATITIDASVNGSDTNYPLAVSETFNPQCGNYAGNYYCFPGPAFSPGSSGPQLTGGTD